MKFIFIILIFSFLLSCSDYQSFDYEKLADRITATTAKRLQRQHNLILIGTGGSMMRDIQMMMMGFQYFKVVDIETARQLLIDAVQEYLFAINSNEEIRPYLHNYPFRVQNVQIVIYFQNPDGQEVPPNKINIAAANEGEVAFYISNHKENTMKTILRETYEEARQKSLEKFKLEVPKSF